MHSLQADSSAASSALQALTERTALTERALDGKGDASLLASVEGRVAALAGRLDACAGRQDLHAVGARVDSLDRALEQLRAAGQQTASTLDELATDVASALEERPTAEVVAAKADRAAIERSLARVRVDLGRRAESADLATVQASLQALSERVAGTEKTGTVALEFIDWYASRGKAYEWNAEALERHMNALAVGNRAAVRAEVAPPPHYST